MANKRLALSLSPSVAAYVSSKARDIGITQAAFIMLCVNQYRQNEDNAKIMSQIPALQALTAMAEVGKKGGE